MKTLRVQAVLATTRKLDKYGGFQLTRDQLESLLQSVQGQAIPMVMNHDSLQGVKASNVEAHIVELDQEDALVIEFDVPADRWDEIQSVWAQAGAPGGFSYTTTATQEIFGEGPPLIVIAADADAFTDEERSAAGKAAASLGPVEVQYIFEFAAELEAARIILEIASQFCVGIAGSLAATTIKDAVDKLFGGNKRQSRVDIRVFNEDGTIKAAGVVHTDDPDVVGRAIEGLEHMGQSGHDVERFDADSKGWVPPS